MLAIMGSVLELSDRHSSWCYGRVIWSRRIRGMITRRALNVGSRLLWLTYLLCFFPS